MRKGYCITYSGCKPDGFVPVVTGPEIGAPLLYLTNESGALIRYSDPYQAEAHAGHYLCKVLNETIIHKGQKTAPASLEKRVSELIRQRREILDVLGRALSEADEMDSEGLPLPDWAEDARTLFAKYGGPE